MRVKPWVVAILVSVSLGSEAFAQNGPLDVRVGKLEKEMKAVQRTVFPQGVPVQPENPAPTGTTQAAGSPASAPIADLTARIDALEKGLAALTGQVEQAAFTNRQQDEAIKRLEARQTAPENAAVAPVGSAATLSPRGSSPTVVKTTAASIRPDTARKAAIAAIEVPGSGDAAEDAYSYAYRLYSGKLYPEAQVKLKEFVAKYPTHKRASYAQNLLGRAYYDEGKPALASVAFYDNYQKMPKGERAAESLYWLGQALTKLKKLPDACKVYDELQDVYGARLTPDLKAKATRGRADAKCPA